MDVRFKNPAARDISPDDFLNGLSGKQFYFFAEIKGKKRCGRRHVHRYRVFHGRKEFHGTIDLSIIQRAVWRDFEYGGIRVQCHLRVVRHASVFSRRKTGPVRSRHQRAAEVDPETGSRNRLELEIRPRDRRLKSPQVSLNGVRCSYPGRVPVLIPLERVVKKASAVENKLENILFPVDPVKPQLDGIILPERAVASGMAADKIRTGSSHSDIEIVPVPAEKTLALTGRINDVGNGMHSRRAERIFAVVNDPVDGRGPFADGKLERAGTVRDFRSETFIFRFDLLRGQFFPENTQFVDGRISRIPLPVFPEDKLRETAVHGLFDLHDGNQPAVNGKLHRFLVPGGADMMPFSRFPFSDVRARSRLKTVLSEAAVEENQIRRIVILVNNEPVGFIRRAEKMMEFLVGSSPIDRLDPEAHCPFRGIQSRTRKVMDCLNSLPVAAAPDQQRFSGEPRRKHFVRGLVGGLLTQDPLYSGRFILSRNVRRMDSRSAGIRPDAAVKGKEDVRFGGGKRKRKHGKDK
ncbi:MAG: hypothetical protein BWY31_04528 [Lentisphaerae bacterium ADurb.Bin242]|nr:MAG: hypothetical protein BWY31_04528 [Lentisphaerae bacterium ADurb.Bin242]